MCGATVADAGLLDPGDARMLLEASDGAQRIGDGDASVVPFMAGDTLAWRFEG